MNGDLNSAIPDAADLMAALAEVPPQWWWELLSDSESNGAHIGPDAGYASKATLDRFEDGFYSYLPHPSTIADAIRACVAQVPDDVARGDVG